MTYLIDSSCFMTASQTTNPIDIAESFWNKIAELANSHKFFSIDRVQTEINQNIDELANWCNDNLPEDFFISTETPEVYEKFAELVNWAQDKVVNEGLKQSGVDKFIAADKADIYLVAFTSLNPEEYTVVTEEKSSPFAKKDIKLPNACAAHHVKCINFMTMLREMKVKF